MTKSKYDMSETIAGTITMMAPEMINGEGYDCSVDVWSLGALLYQILVGKIPFNGKNEYQMWELVNKGSYKIPSSIKVS